MNKSKMIEIAMSTANLSKTEAQEIINAIFDAALKEFENTDQLKYLDSWKSNALIEFGDFGLSKHKGRKQAKSMKIVIMDGDVVYQKKDGSKSEKSVSKMRELEFLGFPIPSAKRCKSVSLISGDPLADRVIFVTASGSNWFSNYIISKETSEVLAVPREFMEVVKTQFNRDLPRDFESAKKLLEEIVQR